MTTFYIWDESDEDKSKMVNLFKNYSEKNLSQLDKKEQRSLGSYFSLLIGDCLGTFTEF